MKLEVGKYYRTEDGEKIGPMALYGDAPDEYHYAGDEYGRLWRGNGQRRYGDSDGVIVGEWADEVVFKVGDRVRRTKDSEFSGHGMAGTTGVVTRVGYNVLDFVDDDGGQLLTGCGIALGGFELIAPAITLEPGKFYKTADGLKVGPMNRRCDYGDFIVRIGDGEVWSAQGRSQTTRDNDIVAEWVDEPAAPKFKVGDRIRSVTDDTLSISVGEEFTVTGVDGEYINFLDRDEDERLRSASKYELVEPGNVKATLPKVGDSVLVLPGAIGAARHYVGEVVKVVDINLANPACPLIRFLAYKNGGREASLINGEWQIVPTPAAATPTIGDWVKDSEGRIGIVFYDDGDVIANLKVGMIEDGYDEYFCPRDLTIVPPGTKAEKPAPASNDNYKVGDIVEIADDGYFHPAVKVGDVAAVTHLKDDDGNYRIRIQTAGGAVNQYAPATAIRPYRRAA